jgi:benzodiazapine receptor
MKAASLGTPTGLSGTQAVIGLIVWVALCFVIAGFGAQFMPGSWYAGLQKPAWNPPAWIFGPVWTVLYLTMGVAAWMVWRRGGFTANALPLGLFLAQLVMNGLWSWMFFGLKQPVLALVDIMALWAFILATIIAFRHPSPGAAWLMVPYLAWVTFAAALNFSLWRLNR